MARHYMNPERKQEMKNELFKFLKSLIGPAVAIIVFTAAILVIMFYQEPEKEEEIVKPNAYEGTADPIVLESDNLIFELDPVTTTFTVTVKSSGKVWRSNPEGADTDPIALSAEKDKLQSTIVMTAATENGTKYIYDSYGYSAKNGIYEIERPDDETIRINYSLGKVKKQFTIPPVLTEEEFKEWTGKMDKKDANLCSEYFQKLDPEAQRFKDSEDYQTKMDSYPLLQEGHIIYVLRSTVKDNLKIKLEQMFENVGLTYEFYLESKERDLSEATNDVPVFNLSVIYRLEGDELVVTVPYDSFDYYSDKPLYVLDILPYFGAGGKQDTGYMLVPEGGGALINFNNGKVSQGTYSSSLYGADLCISRKELVHETRAYYNVYGISNGEDSFICVLEDGAAYASVYADVAGKSNSFNFVYPEYSINQREQYNIGDIANSDIFQYLYQLPTDEVLSQRYCFVDSGDYVDMAKRYAEYLDDKYGSDFAPVNDASTPVALDILGCVDKKKQVMGIPISLPLELTNTKEAEKMLEELTSAGLDNISAKYIGWCNGGANQKILKMVHILSDIGGKKGLKSLSAKADSLGVDFYLNGVTQFEYDSTIFNGFFSFFDAARFITKERAELSVFSDVTYGLRDGVRSYHLLHTDLAMKMADKLSKIASDYNAGVSFQEIGKSLSSDFDRDDFRSRETVRNLESDKVKSIHDAGQKVMINMGSDYVAFYSDMITDMDLKGSNYTLLDLNVPFFQLATHGHLNYTGESINICGDSAEEILLCAEYGAGLHYTLMDETAFTLQDSLYTKYYGCEYSVWRDRIVKEYSRYNKELGHVFDQEMTGHVKLEPEVSCTVYADGTKVYVNYKYTDYTLDDGTVLPAREYVVIR